METFDIVVKIMEKYNIFYEVAESIFLNDVRSKRNVPYTHY